MIIVDSFVTLLFSIVLSVLTLIGKDVFGNFFMPAVA